MNKLRSNLKNLYLKAVGRLVYIFIAISALVFLPAWTFDYWQAWLFLAVFSVSLSAIFIYLAKNDSHLLAGRLKNTEKETSQKIIRSLVNLVFTAVIVVSALDHRFTWSAPSFQAVIFGNSLVAFGLLIIFFVFKENTFTAQTVEVEAGQKVISTGLYSIVRHPMYMGGLVLISGIPPALGSWWALLICVLLIPVLVWRIDDEEKMLVVNLGGYAQYRDNVKYRLIPLIW